MELISLLIFSSDDDGNLLRYRKMSDWALREGKRLLTDGVRV